MESLKVVADGPSDGARANARGKLFENVCAHVLRHHGYDIDEQRVSVTYAGMELDIEGRARIAHVPLYAECKCYTTNVVCEKLQTFYGKYMTRWFKDNKAQGLFLALPGINSPAMGFYRENCEANHQITLKLLQEPEVLEALMRAHIVASPESFQNRIELENGTSGDRVLVCSDKGFFWLQYLVPPGAGIAKAIQIFDALGNSVFDRECVSYLTGLMPEMERFEIIYAKESPTVPNPSQRQTEDDIVEVRGSSACFEYQFPASPEFFVGRERSRREIQEYFQQVVRRQTSSRGILFEANSGWGKSSLVLATVDSLTQAGHYAVAFDSRSASSPHFVLSAVEHILDRFGTFNGALTEKPVLGGFDAATDSLLRIGRALEPNGKLLVLFFDQFENVFHLIDVLSRLAQLSLKVRDAGTNVVLGFSWKTDLVGLTRDFPYRWRDTIIDTCRLFRLPPFSETDTNGLLDRLASDLHTRLRKDLRFLLSECSQGYPWLLKKLCAHVKSQRQAGVVQSEMVRAFLNVEQLFLEDLEGLTPEQDEALRRTARLAPVAIGDISEEFGPEVIQSLVDRRLIVRVASKYDIYWDIFRDYLNTGKLPIEEVYLLRAQVGSIMNVVAILRQEPEGIRVTEFKSRAGLSDGAFFNVTRDLRLLQLAQIQDDTLRLSLLCESNEAAMVVRVRDHLKERLPRNRCVHHVLRVLREQREVALAQLAEILRVEFPYISAVERTWRTYARILASWLDVSDLAIFEADTSKLLRHEAGAQIRERSLTFARRRSGIQVPAVHFSPVVQVAARLVSAVQREESVDWSGISKSTVYKSLSVLEDLELIGRKAQVIYVQPACHTFTLNPERRVELARTTVAKWPVFAAFLQVLEANASRTLTHKQLAERLAERHSTTWKASTAETNVKIMLDWARHLGLAVGPYAHSARGRFKRASSREDEHPLFDFARNSKADLDKSANKAMDNDEE